MLLTIHWVVVALSFTIIQESNRTSLSSTSQNLLDESLFRMDISPDDIQVVYQGTECLGVVVAAKYDLPNCSHLRTGSDVVDKMSNFFLMDV
jgi:hypothetical protein